MMRFELILLTVLALLTHGLLAQRNDKLARYFGEPILTDTLSTIFIPTRYNDQFLSDNKIALWGDVYANMVVYNYTSDTYRNLFTTDTYIKSFRSTRYGQYSDPAVKNLTNAWVFLLVKDKDTNGNGRIDDNDPWVLYATTTKGEELKALTDQKVSVESFELYGKEGFGLIKFQGDANNDGSFKNEDKDYFFRKIDLTTLSLGKEIKAN